MYQNLLSLQKASLLRIYLDLSKARDSHGMCSGFSAVAPVVELLVGSYNSIQVRRGICITLCSLICNNTVRPIIHKIFNIMVDTEISYWLVWACNIEVVNQSIGYEVRDIFVIFIKTMRLWSQEVVDWYRISLINWW